MATAGTQADGRRLRRERNRTAVIDAVFALLAEGHFPPAVEDVAARSGVSVSSVFRYFDGVDDLHEETVHRYFERFSSLFDLPPAEGTLADRSGTFVRARSELYEATAPIARMARHRAPLEPRIGETLLATRASLRDQIPVHFAPELRGLTRAERSDVVGLVDALTAFEAWDLLTAQGRSRAQVERAWTRGLSALLTPA